MKKIKELYKIVISWFDGEDEWHDIYVYGRINNGQGRKDNEERY